VSALPARWSPVVRDAVALGRRLRDAGAVTQALYERHFARWTAPAGPPRTSVAGAPAFVEAVALSVSEASMWEHGWEVIEHAGDCRFVHNGYLRLFLQSVEELHPRDAKVGRRASVRMPCLREGLMPGFLYAFSRAGMIDPAAPHVRMYLNVDAVRAAALMKALLTSPEVEALRFEAKMPNDPAAFERCDTMLIYAEPDDAAQVLAAVRALHRAAPRGWRPSTPFAALELEPGIALAESPPMVEGEARSMGLHRCELVARAALARGDVAAQLAELLRREAIDPAAPHAQRLKPAFWQRLLKSAQRA
jgi:hypothetical protein